MAVARSRSSTVSPPAEWVESDRVTVFQRMSMSGWWFGLLGQRPHPVHVGEGLGEVRPPDLLDQLDALAGPGQTAGVELGVHRRVVEHGRAHGWVISSGRTASSNCSPLRYPSSTAAWRRVVRCLWAHLATSAPLS